MPKLTDHRIARSALPSSGQAFLWCSQDRGFGVRLSPTGTRTFVVQGRVDGRERRISIGRCGIFTVDQARDQARGILRDMRFGIDPIQRAKAQEHAGITLRDAIADYCENKRTKHGPLTPRTLSDIHAHACRAFLDWLDKPVRGITRDSRLDRRRCLRGAYRPRFALRSSTRRHCKCLSSRGILVGPE